MQFQWNHSRLWRPPEAISILKSPRYCETLGWCSRNALYINKYAPFNLSLWLILLGTHLLQGRYANHWHQLRKFACIVSSELQRNEITLIHEDMDSICTMLETCCENKISSTKLKQCTLSRWQFLRRRWENNILRLQRFWTGINSRQFIFRSILICFSSGLVKKKLGKYEEAAEDYQKALDIVEHCFGAEHPKVGMYLNNLADCCIQYLIGVKHFFFWPYETVN